MLRLNSQYAKSYFREDPNSTGYFKESANSTKERGVPLLE